MLLPDNIHPENTIYYNGSIVLKTLLENNSIDIIDLYQKVKLERPMSFKVFILCLDWLYLLYAAYAKNNKIELCS